MTKQCHRTNSSRVKTISKEGISCKAASRIAQLRLQHVPLNSYLFQFKRVDKPSCPACGEAKENIAHFLLRCPSYAFERWALARQAKKNRKHMTVESLLGNPELAAPLSKYIESTGRFKIKLGEQTYERNSTSTHETHSR